MVRNEVTFTKYCHVLSGTKAELLASYLTELYPSP